MIQQDYDSLAEQKINLGFIEKNIFEDLNDDPPGKYSHFYTCGFVCPPPYYTRYVCNSLS